MYQKNEKFFTRLIIQDKVWVHLFDPESKHNPSNALTCVQLCWERDSHGVLKLKWHGAFLVKATTIIETYYDSVLLKLQVIKTHRISMSRFWKSQVHNSLFLRTTSYSPILLTASSAAWNTWKLYLAAIRTNGVLQESSPQTKGELCNSGWRLWSIINQHANFHISL